MSEALQPPATATGIYVQSDLPIGALVAGRFRIEAMLGVGGMGMVYRATDTALDVPVALKLLRPELAAREDAFERFRQELLLARQVSSAHVVRIHDLAQHEGRWLISMDYVDGESLDRRLDREVTLPIDEALRITRDIADGLSAAHGKGVVHRDLKPANILLDKQGVAYISDFGVARSLAGSGLTATGAVVGTPEYLSPEQARGGAIDTRSDLYTLGLILYEMLAGKPPFSGGTVAEILAQRLVRTPEPITKHRKDVPAWVARLVDKLLRAQPAHRFRDARMVMDAIDKRDVAREFRATRGVWIGFAVTLVIAAIGGGWWWSQRGAKPAGAIEIAQSRPLQRLLVMPIEMPEGDAATTAMIAATGARLRDALAEIPGFAVADGQRTWQAMRQLGAAANDVGTLQRLSASQRVLKLRVQPASKGWRAIGELHAGAGESIRIDGATASDPVAAVQAWAAAPSTANVLGVQARIPALLLPTPEALQAYGEALQATQRGELPNSLQHMQVATAKAPDDAGLWLAQAEAAEMIGDEDAAFAAIEGGQASAERAPARLKHRYLAERAMLEGDAPAAVAQWRALVAATPDDTEAALQLARAQGSGGDFKTAVASLQALTARDAQDPRGWYELGKFSILSGDAQRAVDEYLVRALVLFKRSSNAFGEAETVNALGIGYGRLGQTADAEEQYLRAIALRAQIGNRRGEATSRSNLAAILGQRGRYDQAAQQLEKARALRIDLDDRAGLAAVEQDLGLLAEERGDYPSALAAYKRSLQAWQNVGDEHGVAQALDAIGFTRYQLGAYDDAQAYWLQSAQTYAGLGDETGKIRTDQNLGLLATARGHWRDARNLLEKSLALAERSQMVEEAAVSRRNLAELEILQGHYTDALSNAGQAEASLKQRQDVRGETDVALLRVQALTDMHADADAAKVLAALSPVLAQASSEQRANAAMLGGVLAQRDGDAATARQRFADAAQLAQRSGIRSLQLQTALFAGGSRTLDADTTNLGNAALRLSWLEQDANLALRQNQPARALAAYRQAQPLLRAGDYRRAWALHRLGAKAFEATGESNEAASANASAQRALQSVLEHMPQARRADFQRAVDAGGVP